MFVVVIGCFPTVMANTIEFHGTQRMNGIVWTQLTADIINVAISYMIYARLIRDIAS